MVDADYVFSLYSPMIHNTESYAGYNIKLLKDNFRSFEILKGRNGGLGIRKGLFYHGKVGYFKELPLASEMLSSQYQKIQELCQNQ